MQTRQIQQFYDEVAKRISHARAEQNPPLTQEELARRTDSLSRSAIANIESFRQRVALHQLLEIASALSRPPSDFIPDLGSISQPERTMPDDEAAKQFISGVLKPENQILNKSEKE